MSIVEKVSVNFSDIFLFASIKLGSISSNFSKLLMFLEYKKG